MRYADLAANRRHVHDASAAMTFEKWDRRFDRIVHGPKMRAQRIFKIRARHRLHGADLDRAGVVYQNVQTTERLVRAFQSRANLSRFANVARKRNGGNPELADALHSMLQPARVTAANCDAGSAPRVFERNCKSQA